MKKFSGKDIAFIRENLVGWFQKNQRDLPWRKTYDPYQVWISEIMLQQTQVVTALPYFDRWMKKLPDVRAVASATEESLLKLWEGLGYYSRVRNIQKAARLIMSEHGGSFPSDYDAILRLPGVGNYTAGAISSIAFNQNRPLVDGNVIRVIARLLDFRGNTRLPESIASFWKRASEILPAGRARDFNQGLMELGAMVCKPQNPDCGRCPVQKICSSFRAGTMNDLPHRGEAVRTESIRVAIAVIRKGGKIFIQKRPASGLMPGLWEFPGGKINQKETPERALSREVGEETGLSITNVRPVMRLRHAYTRFRVDLYCFEADYGAGRVKLRAASRGKWVPPETLKNYPFPAANVRLIARILK